MKRIYVASSWRNAVQPFVVRTLREAGHEVYDFRNPAPGNTGFHWSAISDQWKRWTANEFRSSLADTVAEEGFALDLKAMQWADTGLLLMPCGRSAHLEAGYFAGARKLLIVLLAEECEPELMYKMADKVCLTIEEVLEALKL